MGWIKEVIGVGIAIDTGERGRGVQRGNLSADTKQINCSFRISFLNCVCSIPMYCECVHMGQNETDLEAVL